MTTPKLIFSFATGMDLAINKDELPNETFNCFGWGFDDADFKFGNFNLHTLKDKVPKTVEPVVKFNLKSTQEFSLLKRVPARESTPARKRLAVGAATRAVVATPTGLIITVPPPAPNKLKGKEILVSDEPVLLEGSTITTVLLVFEMGSSSGITPLTKSQRRNRNRRMTRLKKAKTDETSVPMAVPEEENELPGLTPLLRGSRFHPLSATSDKENSWKIATIAPQLSYHKEQ